ncbi:hypothetical protein NX779_00405 [Mycoplasma cottewii]|uniref:Uncharacterized protein n=1 Tax=Mycoplasma cottewii TaxID=51364 RepID=A0ABY5U0U5_9MOLU|nr:hypothetical protein [Mycoplasma cottewii]UWD35108.1 hypothetical protein NX779_00405 [Mycoplasma cottewii]
MKIKKSYLALGLGLVAVSTGVITSVKLTANKDDKQLITLRNQIKTFKEEIKQAKDNLARLTGTLTTRINAIKDKVEELAETTEKNIADLKTIFNTNLKSLNEFKLKNFRGVESTFYFVIYENNQFKVNENKTGSQIPNIEAVEQYKTEMAKKEENKNILQREKEIITAIIQQVSSKIRESMQKTFNEAVEQVKKLEELTSRLEGLNSQELTDLLKDNGQDLTGWETKDLSVKIEIIKNVLTSKDQIIQGLIGKINEVNGKLETMITTIDNIDGMLEGKTNR